MTEVQNDIYESGSNMHANTSVNGITSITEIKRIKQQ